MSLADSSVEDAEESFKTVVIAFAIARAQLAIQYLICEYEVSAKG